MLSALLHHAPPIRLGGSGNVLFTPKLSPRVKDNRACRYTFSKKGTLTPEEAQRFGLDMKKPEDVTLETEFEKIKTIDIDNWQPVRGPRPWEDETLAPVGAKPAGH